MTTDQDHEIALYHPNRVKVLAVIGLLESEFNCLEIREWGDLKKTEAEILIILFPELLIPEVSADEIKKVIEGLEARIVLVHSNHTTSWINGKNISVLKNPSPETLETKLRLLQTFPRLAQSKRKVE